MRAEQNFVFFKEATQAGTSNTLGNTNGDSLSLQVGGTFSSATLVVQGRADFEGSFFTMSVLNVGTVGVSASITAPGIYSVIGIEGVQQIRVVIQSVSGGNVSVFGRLVNTAGV